MSKKLKVGITGQIGFIGTHLYNTFCLYPDKFSRIPFDDDFFNDTKKLEKFVTQCDVIVHLAAMNRHNDPQIIYNTNIKLVNALIGACESTNSRPHILFSSSTQEETDNLYGKSKKDGRKLFENWAKRNNAKFTGFIIPNVFGPFGHPYYNSVIATFCYQLTHNEEPQINVDSEVRLIYVSDLVKEIIDNIESCSNKPSNKSYIDSISLPYSSQIKVSELLHKIAEYKENYFKKGIIPDLTNSFEKNLFNTFLSFIDHKNFFPFYLSKNTDNRGAFVEILKLNSGGQISFSTTQKQITRGNHFHTRKAERFAVIKGKALIELRRIGTEDIISFNLDGDTPSFVDMPIWFTHNITNIGEEDLYTIFWINEHFDMNDPDTYYENVRIS